MNNIGDLFKTSSDLANGKVDITKHLHPQLDFTDVEASNIDAFELLKSDLRDFKYLVGKKFIEISPSPIRDYSLSEGNNVMSLSLYKNNLHLVEFLDVLKIKENKIKLLNEFIGYHRGGIGLIDSIKFNDDYVVIKRVCSRDLTNY